MSKEILQAIENLKTDLITKIDNLTVTVEENNQLLKALEHNVKVRNAEIDKLNIEVAYVHGNIKEIKTELYNTEEITGQNIKDIAKLKKQAI